jgi:hypothetical protein
MVALSIIVVCLVLIETARLYLWILKKWRDRPKPRYRWNKELPIEARKTTPLLDGWKAQAKPAIVAQNSEKLVLRLADYGLATGQQVAVVKSGGLTAKHQAALIEHKKTSLLEDSTVPVDTNQVNHEISAVLKARKQFSGEMTRIGG